MTGSEVKRLAAECGFELAGVARAAPVRDAADYLDWAGRGMAGAMSYLTDRRAGMRLDPRHLLATARSVVCIGKLYHTDAACSTAHRDDLTGWISRYAWGDDYHGVLREGLERLAEKLREALGPFDYKVCVDTAPLLERSYARMAGLGWIGKNTCLINEPLGSWFFLGELLTSLELAPDGPPPDRCGACTRCIDACPTGALNESGGRYELDARRCISYFTIELRGASPGEFRSRIGDHVFGCDICQDVCPWNRAAPVTDEPAFAPRHFAPPLAELAAMGEAEFRARFGGTAIARARYAGFLRNVAIAMGNSGRPEFRGPLETLAGHSDAVVRESARWALARFRKLKGARDRCS